MLKSKRSNYLIDKPFQIGFIIRFLLIIFITIVLVFCITGFYYWFVSYFGKYKLDSAVDYIYRGHKTHNGKKDGYKVFNYDLAKIQVYEEIDNTGKKSYHVYRIFNETPKQYKKDQVVEVTDLTKLKPEIGEIRIRKTVFLIVLFPLLWTCIALLIIVSVYSLFFSHRMAGPIYRIRISLDRMLSGDLDFKIRARRTDFFLNIVDKLEQFRQQVFDKLKSKNKKSTGSGTKKTIIKDNDVTRINKMAKAKPKAKPKTTKKKK